MRARSNLWPAILFVSLLVLYGATACPGVFLGDSGELTAAAIRLDIAHPPGYPLYTLVGRLFALAAPGPPAARVASLSAAAAALAGALFFLVCRKRAGIGPSLLATALFGTAPLVWSQAVVAEVYALHVALFLVALLLLLRAEEGGGLAGAGYASGLAAAAHPLGIGLWLLLPVAAALRKKKRAGAIGELLTAYLFAVAALTIFLYLPVRSASNPPVDWGNPETLRAFLAHVLRSQYSGVPHPDFAAGTAIRQITAGFAMLFDRNVPLVFAPLVAIGWAGLLRESPKRAVLPTAGLVLYGPVLIAFLRYPLAADRVEENQVFLLPLLVFLLLFLASGAEVVAGALGRRGRAPALAALFAVPALLFPVRLAGERYDRVTLPEAYAREALLSLPEGAALDARGDDLLFPLLYLRAAENLRPDVGIHNPSGAVFSAPPRNDGFRYFSWPADGAVPSGLLFREEGAPPLREPRGLPEAPASERTVKNDDPLLVFWVNSLETRARSDVSLERAAGFRLAALRLAADISPPPGDAGRSYALASVLVDRGRYDEAETMLRRIVSESPGEPLPRLLLAELLLQGPEAGEAKTLANPEGDSPAAVLTRSAAILAYAGETARAEKLLLEAVHKDRGDVEALDLLRRIATDRGDDVAAVRWGERALVYDPTRGEIRLGVARAYHRLGDDRSAARHYRAIVLADPLDPAAPEAARFLGR